MAVTDGLPGVEVAILVNGTALKEYNEDDSGDKSKTTSCYIEATSQQTFAISVKLLPNYVFKGQALAVYNYVDGNLTCSKVFKPSGKRELLNEGPAESQLDKDLRYCFASVQMTSDHGPEAGEKRKLQNVGIIEVHCFHVKIKRRYFSQVSATDTSGLGVLPEEVLKGQTVSHSVSFTGRRSKLAAQTSWEWLVDHCPVAREPGKETKFKFHYRSLNALTSMGLILQASAPLPLEQRDFTTLSHDELRELQRIVQRDKPQQRDHTEDVKQELDDKKPKRRRIARPSAGDTQLEVDDAGRVQEISTASLPAPERVVVEID